MDKDWKRKRTAQIRRRTCGATLCIGMLLIVPSIITMANRKTEPEQVKAESTELTAGVSSVMIDYMENVKTVPIVQEEKETQPNEATEVNSKELEMLARLIHAEVGIVKDDECLYACGSVVLNRVASDKFPNTIEGVIYQTKPTLQYACTEDGNFYKEPDERCYEIAEDLLRNGSCIPEDVIYQAEFKQGSGVWKTFENVVYCHE